MTFSIVAKDPRSGAFGVATATGNLAVGSLVPHAAAGIGAVATQGFSTNPFYGRDGIDLLARGRSAEEVVATLTRADEGRARRQLVVIDATGRTAAWTGDGNEGALGHACHDGFAVAGNFLAGDEVLEMMATVYQASSPLPFAERLLHTLKAGEAAGGDKRGCQSCALFVMAGESYPRVDLRVDDHSAPLDELFRLYGLTQDPDYLAFLDRLPTREHPHRS